MLILSIWILFRPAHRQGLELPQDSISWSAQDRDAVSRSTFLHGLDSVTIADCDVFVFRRHHGKRPLLMSVSLLTTKSDTLFVDAELGITNPRWTTPTYQPTLFSYLASFGAIGSDSSIAHTAICLVHRVLISNLQDQQCRNVDHAHRRPLPSQHRYSQQI